MKEEYMKDLRVSKIQNLKIIFRNLKEFFSITIICAIITVFLIYMFAPPKIIEEVFKEFLKDLIDLLITVIIGGFLLTLVTSLYRTQQEYDKIRKDLIDKLFNSYSRVKRIRRIQKYEKRGPHYVQESQLNELIDAQLEFENYMNQIDWNRNIFKKEKADLLHDMAHQMEHYLNKLSDAFAILRNSETANTDEKDKQKIEIDKAKEKINDFINTASFNNDFSYIFHESLRLIRNDFLCHTQMSINNDEYENAMHILTRAQCMEMRSKSK